LGDYPEKELGKVPRHRELKVRASGSTKAELLY
jgi:hypothetical protein